MALDFILGFINDHPGWSGVLAFLASATVVQVTPIKINPWTWIADQVKKLLAAIGRATNQDLHKDISEIHATQNELSAKIDANTNLIYTHIKTDDERDMDQRRQRIFRFEAEITRGIKFTREYAFDILDDVDVYENYCDAHSEYRNSKAVLTIENVKKVIADHEARHDWLY